MQMDTLASKTGEGGKEQIQANGRAGLDYDEGAGKALDTVTARLIRDRIGDWIWARARARVLGSGVA